jgi:diguanylate cyclase (GGDEF)-like protein
VVFEGLRAREAIPHLEAVRADIEAYRLAIRAADREPGQGRGKRGGRRAEDSVSVTTSFGVAERDERHRSPEAVLKAADSALYRAKEKGRNRVSR